MKTISKCNPKGLTLLEMVIALALLASALLIVIESQFQGIFRARKTQIQFEMTLLLKTQMNRILEEYAIKGYQNLPETLSGDFGQDYPGYRWELKTQPAPEGIVAQHFNFAQSDPLLNSIIQSLDELARRSWKQVTLSVTYDKARKPITRQVTTWVVDRSALSQWNLPFGRTAQ